MTGVVAYRRLGDGSIRVEDNSRQQKGFAVFMALFGVAALTLLATDSVAGLVGVYLAILCIGVGTGQHLRYIQSEVILTREGVRCAGSELIAWSAFTRGIWSAHRLLLERTEGASILFVQARWAAELIQEQAPHLPIVRQEPGELPAGYRLGMKVGRVIFFSLFGIALVLAFLLTADQIEAAIWPLIHRLLVGSLSLGAVMFAVWASTDANVWDRLRGPRHAQHLPALSLRTLSLGIHFLDSSIERRFFIDVDRIKKIDPARRRLRIQVHLGLLLLFSFLTAWAAVNSSQSDASNLGIIAVMFSLAFLAAEFAFRQENRIDAERCAWADQGAFISVVDGQATLHRPDQESATFALKDLDRKEIAQLALDRKSINGPWKHWRMVDRPEPSSM